MTQQQVQPAPAARCKACGHRWAWHRLPLGETPGHQTEFGYCSCPAFVPRPKRGQAAEDHAVDHGISYRD